MKLIFKTLKTPSDTIQVSFDSVTYKSYVVVDAKNGISFTSDECPDLTKIRIKGKFTSLGIESIDVEKTLDLSEKIEFDVSLNDGIEFFSKVECFKDGEYYKLRFYPSEKLEQVVSINYKGMSNKYLV